VIYPACDPLDEEFARAAMKRDKSVLIHWYYFPDSHDSWVQPQVELPVDPPESPPTHSGVWRVIATWVLDLEQYNEWMTEEDYEVDEAGRKKVHKLRLSVDDLMGSSDAGAKKKPSKRKRSPSPPPKQSSKRKRLVSIIQGDPDHPEPMFFSGTVNPIEMR